MSLAVPRRSGALAALLVLGSAVVAACATGSTGAMGAGGAGGDGSEASVTAGAGGSTTTVAGAGGATTGTTAGSTSASSSGATTASSSTSTSTSASTSASAGAGGGGAGCALDHVVISEIRSRGPAGAADELVELYNPTASDVTLDATWKLEGRSVSGASYTARWKGTGKVLPAHGHFLIVGTAYAQSPAADETLGSGVTDATSLRLTSNGATVDAVCYGYDATTLAAFDATFTCEGTPVDNTPHDDKSTAASNVDVSIERKPGGAAGNCTDTGDSASDFATASPATPLDAASAPTP